MIRAYPARFHFVPLLLLLMPAPCLAMEGGVSEVIEALRAASQDVRTVQSDFTQEKRLKAFASTMRSTGRMYLEKPDKLRWEYLVPGKSGFAVNGDVALRWNEFDPKAEPFALDDDPMSKAVSQQLLAWAGMDLARLGKRFDISVVQANPPILALKARDGRMSAYLKELRIHFAANMRSVTMVELFEPDGDATILSFENTRLNEPVPEKAFDLSVK